MGNIDELIANLAQDATAVKPAPHPYIEEINHRGYRRNNDNQHPYGHDKDRIENLYDNVD